MGALKLYNHKNFASGKVVQGLCLGFKNNCTDRLRFGFNCMEKDNEIKGTGNSLDFGARIYDSRLERWLLIDPSQAKYPNSSPYNFCNNNPLIFNAPDGKDAKVSITGNNITISMTNFVFAKAASQEYVNQYNAFYEQQKGNLTKCVNIDGDRYNVTIEMKFVVGTPKDMNRINSYEGAIGKGTGENTMEIYDKEGTPGAWGNSFRFYNEKGKDGKIWVDAKNNNAVFHDLTHLLGFIDRYSDTKNEDGKRETQTDFPGWKNDVMSGKGLYYSENYDPFATHFYDIGKYIIKNLPKGGVLSFPDQKKPLPVSENQVPFEDECK